jgi:hypothetical protein
MIRSGDDFRVDDTATRAVGAIMARDWSGVRLLLHPYLHWTDVSGRVVRGRQNVITMLESMDGVDQPASIELRDGQISRWRCR